MRLVPSSSRLLPAIISRTSSAKSSMSPIGTTSYLFDILVHQILVHVFLHPPAEQVRLRQIGFPAEDCRQLILGIPGMEEVFPRGIDFHQDIDVAPLRIEVIARHGAEKRELAD